MVVTLLVAVALVLPIRRAIQQEQGREWVETVRGRVVFKYPYNHKDDEFGIVGIPEFMIHWFGIDLFNPVVGVVLDCEIVEDLSPLANLSMTESLLINIEMADDLDFSPLVKLPQLKELHFTEHSLVTRRQIEHLRHLLPGVNVTADEF